MIGVSALSEEKVVFAINAACEAFKKKDGSEVDPTVKTALAVLQKLASSLQNFSSVNRKNLAAKVISHVSIKMSLNGIARKSIKQLKVIRLLDLSIRGALMSKEYIYKGLCENDAGNIFIKEVHSLKVAEIEELTKKTLTNIGARNPCLAPAILKVNAIIGCLQAKDGKHNDMVKMLLSDLKTCSKKLVNDKAIFALEKEVFSLAINTPYEAACVPLIYALINLSYCVLDPITF